MAAIESTRGSTAAEAIEALRLSIQGGRGGVSTAPGGVTFPALRVSGPARNLFVTTREDRNGVVFLAPAVDEVPYCSECEVIGSVDRITEVAGILRRRVTATP